MPEDKPAGTTAKKKASTGGPDTAATGRATERPVLQDAPPRTTQYLVTVDNRTGIAMKIEKVDAKTGEKTELTAQEYALIYPYGRPRAATPQPAPAAAGSPPRAMSDAATSSDSAALTDAYYRGVADYIKALTG